LCIVEERGIEIWMTGLRLRIQRLIKI
jgi:hypothetical protein